jgi:hypothetical protein
MKVEVYLDWGREEELIGADLYVDGERVGPKYQHTKEGVVNAISRFYEVICSSGLNPEVEIKNRGLKEELIKEVREQVFTRLKTIKPTTN